MKMISRRLLLLPLLSSSSSLSKLPQSFLSPFSTATTAMKTKPQPESKSPPKSKSENSSKSKETSSGDQASPPSLMTSYLVKNLSFSESEALSMASRYNLHRLASTSSADSLLSLLRSSAHLSPSQLRRFVRLRPTLLASPDPSSTLLPKLNLLKSLLPSDHSPDDLATLVTSCAAAFGYSAQRHISPSIAFLRSLFNNDDRKVVAALRRHPRILTHHPDRILSRNADLLRTRGNLSPSQLAEFVHKAPLVLYLAPFRLESAFALVESEFRIDMSSSPDKYINTVVLVASVTEGGFLKKIEILRRFGFGNEQMLELFRKCPSFMRLKDEYMERKLEFFRDEVGVGPQELIYNAWVLMFSLDTKLAPRYGLLQGLKERGLIAGGERKKLLLVLIMNEKAFSKEFVDRFKDGKGADLISAYLNSLVAVKEVASPKE